VRILFVALTSPFPPTSGHRLRTWSMLRALAAEGHQVTLRVLADDEDDAEAAPLREVCRDVRVWRVPRPHGARHCLGRLAAVLSPLPYAVRRLASPALRSALAEELGRGSFDAVLCDGVYNLVNVPDTPGVPLVLNKDDVAHVILERYRALEPRAWRRAYASLEARKVRAWERRAGNRAALVLASSEVDRELLERLCRDVDVAVVPNVVDAEACRPQAETGAPVVLYQGGMDWHPNRDAVAFFAARVWPRLRARAPHAVFRVAGRAPDARFRRRMEAAGVQFAGRVPDMRVEIARAAVCVVPLRIGSGTRLKILEAAAMGKPVVSTRLGAEGLDFADGREILLADEPAELARLTAELLADAPRRRALGSAARRRVEALYSQPVLRRALRAALARLSPREASRLPARHDGAGVAAGLPAAAR
jgi:glycosyltransferase involved in cell wall biosynthesis